MKIKAYTLNSFAKSLNGGNPAAVVLDADNLLEEQMKKYRCWKIHSRN